MGVKIADRAIWRDSIGCCRIWLGLWWIRLAAAAICCRSGCMRGRRQRCARGVVAWRPAHSRYERTLADAPMAGRRVSLQLRVRRFFCPTAACPIGTFVEQVEGLTTRLARRTSLLHGIPEAIVWRWPAALVAALCEALRGVVSGVCNNTHRGLAGACEPVGLSTRPDAGTKFERASASFDAWLTRSCWRLREYQQFNITTG